MSLIHAHHPDHADVDHTDVDQTADRSGDHTRDHIGDTDRAERLDAGAHGAGFGTAGRHPSPSGVIDLRVPAGVGDSPDAVDPIDAADTIDRRDTDVEFSALGKSPTEARVELFSSLTRLEPTTVTGRMLERTPDPVDVAGFDALAGRLPYVAAAPTLSLPYAVDDPEDPAARERRPRRRPLAGAMAAGVLSAGFAVTLFAGPGLGPGAADRSVAPTAGATAPAGITRDLGAGPSGVPAPAAPAGATPRPAQGSAPGSTLGPVAAPAVQPVRAMFAGGRLIFTGTVASRAEGDALVARAAGLLGPDGVVDQLVVDGAAPPVTALPVQVAERVRFAPGSTAIDGDYVALVSAWRDVLAAVPSVQMRVTGFTDDRGPAAVNDRLALARAQGLADWMQAQGIDGARIVVAGGGASSPVASNDTPEGRAENRRIQVELHGLLPL